MNKDAINTDKFPVMDVRLSVRFSVMLGVTLGVRLSVRFSVILGVTLSVGLSVMV